MQERVLPLEGVNNFRDFGGYAVSGGMKIKRGLLFRSGHYAEATPGDVSKLETLSIALQADLRRPDERERQVAKWPGERVTVIVSDGGRESEAPHQRFLKEVEADAEKAASWMNEYYLLAPFKAHHVELYTAWFDRLAGLDETEAAVINCAAGKDRTGIACALTKYILGASDRDIVSDYLLTNDAVNMAERLPLATSYFNDMLGKAYSDDVYRPFMGVEERFLHTAFASIKDQTGSIDAYLSDVLDVTEAKRAALKARLLEPA